MSSKTKKVASSSQSQSQQASEQVTSSERPTSPLSPSRLTRLQEKNELQNLNDRLANYIERVRNLELENNRLNVQVQSSSETVSREVVSIKTLYEKELTDTRKLLDETAKDKARLQIDANKLNIEKDELQHKLAKKERDLASLEKKINGLESNIEELKNRLNQTNADKKRVEDDLKNANAEQDNLAKQLATVRKQLQEETLLRVDVENRLQSIKEDFQFKEQVHQKELEESRIIQETEISQLVNDELREQYEQRLADELRELREENEAQLRINREDVEQKYENQIIDLQTALDQQTLSTANLRNELKNLKTKNESSISRMNQLESVNLSLQNRIKDLERLIEQERQWHEDALKSKDDIINQLREEAKQMMSEYQDLLDIKIALDMEINAYRKLLEGEESRLNLPSSNTPPSRLTSPRNYTPKGNKRKRVFVQEEENLVDINVDSKSNCDVEINDQDQEGKFVKLYNKGEKEVSLSGWQLMRKAGELETHFKFHRTIVIKPNTYVTVWGSDSNAAHNPPSDIVMKGQKWFVADTMTTQLLNNAGEEMAVRETSKRMRSSLSHRTPGLWRSQAVTDGNSAERCSIM